jgi:antitoxin PrlF
MLHSKVTGRWQTTLPSGVRKALGLDAGAEILYEIRGDYAVIRKAEPEGEDPVVVAFLDFLEGDMRAHPENLTPVTESLVARLRGLTEGVEVRHDEQIEGNVAL